MSEFAVYRTLGNGRCLVLDGTRIAGGKPDYRGNNYITSWVTNKTYGPIDELKDENAKLRELCRKLGNCAFCCNGEQLSVEWDASSSGCGIRCTVNGEGCSMFALIGSMRELGIEVDG